MARQLSSGISIEEESPQVRSIIAGPSAITAALGITERGPFKSQLITSFDQYKRVFGGHILNGYLSHAVQGFFENGGGAMYVKRVVHHTDATDASSKTSAEGLLNLSSGAGAPSAGYVVGSLPGPFSLTSGQTLNVVIDGGDPATATFTGVAASRTAANAGPYALADNQTLTVAIDGGAPQTITFLTSEFAAIGAATAAEAAAVINAKINGARADVDGGAVRLTSDRKGTTSHVDVTGGTANGVLGFATGDVAGSGNVADLAAVSITEVKSIVEAAVAGSLISAAGSNLRLSSTTTGGGSSVQVQHSSTARTALGLDTAVHEGGTGSAADVIEVRGKTDGSYANDLVIVVSTATSGRETEFNLTVEEDGIVRETWPNLSVDTLSPDYHEVALNDENAGSNLIKTVELIPGVRPANGTFGPLTGGADGLSGIGDLDFIGARGAQTGLHGFNLNEDARVLISPDRETALMHVAMITYATMQKKGALFPVLSSPLGLTVEQVRTYVTTTAGLENLSEFGAIYYPNIKVLNPNKALYGSAKTLTIPPCGHIAGIYARTDASSSGGVYQAPAGTEKGRIFSCAGLETDATQEEANRDLLYPERINPIRYVGGVPVLDGVRTLKGDSNFPSISERRGVIFIEQAIKDGLEFVRFRNNDETLRAEVERTIQAFLNAQMLVGAFRSRERSKAFIVDVSEALNTPTVVFAGQLIARVGLATQKPAEFIFLRFSQDTRAIEAELAAS